MTAVKAIRPFLNIKQAAEYLQEMGFDSCTTDTIRYLAYEKGLLPRPKIVGGRAYWSRADLDQFVADL
ncbi:MerR family transcriptional regulator [Mycolicibacterium stellerae]|uniref:helix-turn-helix domain-containing protein n=1 Tax=Mycolicibacterium stellerae TaxID=2358193 RepID=UPI000F0B223C|nr:helix-turn-helix domain-containing protein [Mycolicibacterium stellerae]